MKTSVSKTVSEIKLPLTITEKGEELHLSVQPSIESGFATDEYCVVQLFMSVFVRIPYGEEERETKEQTNLGILLNATAWMRGSEIVVCDPDDSECIYWTVDASGLIGEDWIAHVSVGGNIRTLGLVAGHPDNMDIIRSAAFLGPEHGVKTGIESCGEANRSISYPRGEAFVCNLPIGHECGHQTLGIPYAEWDNGGASSRVGGCFGIPGNCACGFVVIQGEKGSPLCSTCDYWINYIKPGTGIVVDGTHYTIDKTGFGFGGRKFKLKFKDDTEMETCLYYQGVIPQRFRHMYHDNAKFL